MILVLLKDPFHLKGIDKKFINKLKKLAKVEIYEFKFDLKAKKQFELKDLYFNNVADDIYDMYKKHNKLLIIGLETTSPYGLYFADKYPKKCGGIICFPLRLQTKESLERRIWKYKDQKGWEKYVSKNYDIDDYFLKINNSRLQEIINQRNNKEESLILMLIVDLSLRKQYKKIPKVFKVPTYLFTRFDLSAKDIIKHNFDRKEIADMKGIMSKDDALFNSLMSNIARVQYDDILIKKNKDNNNLRIQYLASMDNKYVDYYQDVVDRVKLIM